MFPRNGGKGIELKHQSIPFRGIYTISRPSRLVEARCVPKGPYTPKQKRRNPTNRSMVGSPQCDGWRRPEGDMEALPAQSPRRSLTAVVVRSV